MGLQALLTCNQSRLVPRVRRASTGGRDRASIKDSLRNGCFETFDLSSALLSHCHWVGHCWCVFGTYDDVGKHTDHHCVLLVALALDDKTMIISLALALMLQPLLRIEKQFGVDVQIVSRPIRWKGINYEVTGFAPRVSELARYIPLFAREWDRYPADLTRKFRIKRIIFVDNLALSGQVRAAVPAFDGDTMYYDPALGNYAPHYQQTVVHHELYHMLDFRKGTLTPDPEWAKLNARGFRYGDGGDKMRDSGAGDLTASIPGFITAYGTSAVEEDKAELYGHLMCDREFVLACAAKDPIIKAKVALLERRLERMGLASVLKPQ